MIAKGGGRGSGTEREKVVRISCQTGLVTITIKTPESKQRKRFLLKQDRDKVTAGVLNKKKLFMYTRGGACILCDVRTRSVFVLLCIYPSRSFFLQLIKRGLELI